MQAATLAPFQILQPIAPAELMCREDLIRHLYRSLSEDPLSATEDELLDDIEKRRVILWTWGKGILMTHTRITKKGLALFVTNVCGEGYLANLAAIDADMTSHAKAIGAKYIIGDVPSKALVRAYERRGAWTLHRVMREVK